MSALRARGLLTSQANLDRWLAWWKRIVGHFGPRAPEALELRTDIARYAGQAGYPDQALRLYQELLPDRVEVLGARHPDTLATRAQIAFYQGEMGHPGHALRLYQELLPDQVEVL